MSRDSFRLHKHLLLPSIFTGCADDIFCVRSYASSLFAIDPGHYMRMCFAMRSFSRKVSSENFSHDRTCFADPRACKPVIDRRPFPAGDKALLFEDRKMLRHIGLVYFHPFEHCRYRPFPILEEVQYLKPPRIPERQANIRL